MTDDVRLEPAGDAVGVEAPAEEPVWQPIAEPGGGTLAAVGTLLEVPLEVTVELGRAQMSIREFGALAPGSVVGLDKLAGEALDILVNGKLLARGEVVVIDDEFGVRITEIVTGEHRYDDELAAR